MLKFLCHYLGSNVSQTNYLNFLRHSSKNYHLKGLLETMPKDMKHVEELRAQRAKNEARKKNLAPPGIAHLVITGNGSIGCPNSVFLVTDHRSYLFNCGEGTQRVSQETG